MDLQLEQFQGYPAEVFYLAALIGVVLLLFRPRWALFFMVLGLAGRHFHMAAFTRIPVLGEFLNLNDLFLWTGFLAMARLVLENRRFWLPNILLALFGILLLGSFQVLFLYGFHRDVMQELWRSWIFPIAFLVGANLVRDNQDARLFFWALFLGALGAAVQHLVFIQYRIETYEASIGFMRTISFGMSGGIFLVVSAFFIDMRKVLRSSYLFLFWVIGISIIAISYLLSFTRTWWVGAFLAGVAMGFLFYREQGKTSYRLGYSLVLLVIMVLVFGVTNKVFLSGVNLTSTIDERADFVRYEDSFEEAYQTRESGMETELEMWKNGTIIWGVGASYPPSIMESPIEATGAVGHVAYSVYLAHFGLIGLITYGLLLPYLTIKVGKRYYLQHSYDIGGVLAITAMALAFFDFFTLLSSNHYIASTSQVQGLIYGSLWGLSRSLGFQAVESSPVKIGIKQQSWLPGPLIR
jgi:hypothetical protein